MRRLPAELWSELFNLLPTLMVRRVLQVSKSWYRAGKWYFAQQTAVRFLHHYFTEAERARVFSALSAGSERQKKIVWQRVQQQLQAYKEDPALSYFYRIELECLLTAPVMVREACLPENRDVVSLWKNPTVRQLLEQKQVNILPYFKKAPLAARLECMQIICALCSLENVQECVEDFFLEYREFGVPVKEVDLLSLKQATKENIYNLFARSYQALLCAKLQSLYPEIDLTDLSGFLGTTEGFQQALMKGDVRLVSLYLLALPTLGHDLLINALLDNGQMAIHFAVSGGHLEVVRVLLLAGADLNVCTDAGQNAVHLLASVKNNSEAMLQLLQHYGVALDMPDAYGATPLHRMARAGNLAGVQILLQHQVAVNTADLQGYTAIQYARQYQHPEIETLLLQSGAKPHPIKESVNCNIAQAVCFSKKIQPAMKGYPVELHMLKPKSSP